MLFVERTKALWNGYVTSSGDDTATDSPPTLSATRAVIIHSKEYATALIVNQCRGDVTLSLWWLVIRPADGMMFTGMLQLVDGGEVATRCAGSGGGPSYSMECAIRSALCFPIRDINLSAEIPSSLCLAFPWNSKFIICP